MTAPPTPRRARATRDLRRLAVAVVLLGASGLAWLWFSADAQQKRDKVLATIPAFPARGQEERPRGTLRPQSAAPGRTSPQPPAARAAPPARPDVMTSFVLKPSHNVALVHVNALLNSPLFDRIRKCIPEEWSAMSDASSAVGFDFERDVDRIALTTDGLAMSGFFEGKPIVDNIVRIAPDKFEQRTYRGNTLWTSNSFGMAQIGNLIVWGRPESMDRLVDRAIDPAPDDVDPQDIYGDVFLRTDLSGLRDRSRATPTMADAILDGLNGVTVRANVWDMVALSVEGTPQPGRSVRDLASMVQTAISLTRDQLDPSDVELATLADLAKVRSEHGTLAVDLALPANDLFDKLHFPCPGAKKPDEPGDQSASQ